MNEDFCGINLSVFLVFGRSHTHKCMQGLKVNKEITACLLPSNKYFIEAYLDTESCMSEDKVHNQMQKRKAQLI